MSAGLLQRAYAQPILGRIWPLLAGYWYRDPTAAVSLGQLRMGAIAGERR